MKTLDYIYNNMLFDVIRKKHRVFTGNFLECILYYEKHDLDSNPYAIIDVSNIQPRDDELRAFVKDYKRSLSSNRKLLVTDFYKTYKFGGFNNDTKLHK